MKVVKHISHSAFQENTYFLFKNDQMIIIDPGDVAERLRSYIDDMNVKVLAVLATHAHVDHIIGASKLCEAYDCPFILNSDDQEILGKLHASCTLFKQPYSGTPAISIDIKNKDQLVIGDFNIKILHTPGHTKGGVCYLIDDILFSGDTLFYRTIGHANQYGGDTSTLLNSIKNVLFELPDNTLVYPGHMGLTTLGDEKKYNPFVAIK